MSAAGARLAERISALSWTAFLQRYRAKHIATGSFKPVIHMMGLLFATGYSIEYLYHHRPHELHRRAEAAAEAERLRVDPHSLAPRLEIVERDLELEASAGATVDERIVAIAADLNLSASIDAAEDAPARLAMLERDLGIVRE